MKFSNPLITVADLDRSKDFYKEMVGLSVILDFGAIVTPEGGLSLQTLDTWQAFIGTDQVTFFSRSSELYFADGRSPVFFKNSFPEKSNPCTLRFPPL